MSVPSYRLTLHLPDLSVLYLPHLQKPPRKKSNHTMMAQVCLVILDLNKQTLISTFPSFPGDMENYDTQALVSRQSLVTGSIQ